MAVTILDLENATPEDSDNIYGDITDDNGSGNGTPMNNKAFHDMFVFFQRLMQKGNVTPNHLPDNAYTGFQLFTALQNLFTGTGIKTPLTLLNSWVTAATAPSLRTDGIGNVYLSGNITAPGSDYYPFVIPSGMRPKSNRLFITFGTSGVCALSIQSTGNVSLTYVAGGADLGAGDESETNAIWNIND